MMAANSSTSFSLNQRLDSLLALPMTAPLALAVVAIAAHGFEVFGFHLTIDEELHSGYRSAASAWLAQGRWGMATLSLLLPNSVTPVISPLLGVGLMGAALWLLLVRHLKLDRILAFVVSGVAISLPTLPFTLSFTTLAYGLGVASVGVYAFARLVSAESSLARLASASVVGAFVVSIYQPLLVVLAALAWLEAFRSSSPRRGLALATGGAAVLGATAAYFLIDALIRAVTDTELRYVEQFIDVPGLFLDPAGRLLASIARNVHLLSLPESRFGLDFRGLGVFVLVSLLISFRPAAGQQGLWRHARFAVPLGIAALVFLADALPASGAPVRSMVYLPFLLALIAAWAAKDLPGWPRIAFFALALWCMIGNIVLCNRLYASAAIAGQRDAIMAQAIIAEVERLGSTPTPARPLKLELAGMRQWPQSALTPKRETLGASFFEWEGGNRFRVASLLTIQGLPTAGISNQERGPYVAMAKEMPAWPRAGSVKIVDGVLILKLGEYSQQQRRKLCEMGEEGFC